MTTLNTISAARAEYARLEAHYPGLTTEAEMDAAIHAMSAAECALIRAPIISKNDALSAAEHLVLMLEEAHESSAHALATKLAKWLKSESAESIGPKY